MPVTSTKFTHLEDIVLIEGVHQSLVSGKSTSQSVWADQAATLAKVEGVSHDSGHIRNQARRLTFHFFDKEKDLLVNAFRRDVDSLRVSWAISMLPNMLVPEPADLRLIRNLLVAAGKFVVIQAKAYSIPRRILQLRKQQGDAKAYLQDARRTDEAVKCGRDSKGNLQFQFEEESEESLSVCPCVCRDDLLQEPEDSQGGEPQGEQEEEDEEQPEDQFEDTYWEEEEFEMLPQGDLEQPHDVQEADWVQKQSAAFLMLVQRFDHRPSKASRDMVLNFMMSESEADPKQAEHWLGVLRRDTFAMSDHERLLKRMEFVDWLERAVAASAHTQADAPSLRAELQDACEAGDAELTVELLSSANAAEAIGERPADWVRRQLMRVEREKSATYGEDRQFWLSILKAIVTKSPASSSRASPSSATRTPLPQHVDNPDNDARTGRKRTLAALDEHFAASGIVEEGSDRKLKQAMKARKKRDAGTAITATLNQKVKCLRA
jgi:hypothetical protein